MYKHKLLRRWSEHSLEVPEVDKAHVDLSTETVEGAARALQGVDDIECGDGLALGVFSVGD